jgi:hypothetical protein
MVVMAKTPTQGQKKLQVQFERLVETDSFAAEIKRVRLALELPHDNSGPTETSRGFMTKYTKETASLRDRLPVVNDYILKQLQNYIFYNKLSTLELGDVCEIEDAETELARYSVNEDPDSSGKSLRSHNDDIEEKLRRYPVSVRIHSDASKRDVLDFIKRNWSVIESDQRAFRTEGRPSLKNSKTRVANKERDAFIYANRDQSHKKIARLVHEKFHKPIDMGTVGKIISNERKRKKV